MSQYNYTKTPVSLDRLTQEINQSAIVTALDHMTLLGAALSIFFKADLSSGDQTILDGLVSAHDGTPLPANSVTNVKITEDVSIPKDSDGSPMQRVKITTTGWHYQLHGIEFETAKLNSIYSKKVDNSDYGFGVIKFYKDVSGTETQITGDDLNQDYLDVHCIKTIIEWEPTHDVEIIGGMMKQQAAPTEDVRLWVVGVPDVPANYGGSKPFVVNTNLRFIGTEEGIKVDGRAPKFLSYSATYHTTKMQMIFRHSAGFKHKLHMVFELFKA